MTDKCLNCDQKIKGNYCSNCGQKTATHRFSIKHFFAHDFIHGIFHLDKGFLFTIKELFTRPGHSIREYIQGKRVNHFNYFTTVIFILALGYFIVKWFSIDFYSLFDESSGYLKVLKGYSKVVPFLGIPFYALASYLFFKKSKQNYTENLILNVYMICGWLSLNLLLKIIMIFIQDIETFQTINLIFVALIYIYVFVFYYQYFSAFKYKKLSLVFRVVVIALLILMIKQQINQALNEIGLQYFY